jgi:hypothetical protein
MQLMAETSSVPVRGPHWVPMDARTELTDAVTKHLRTLDGLDPDRFTLAEVIVELGVASARSQLDQVPSQLMRAAAGMPARSCQVRLSRSELEALLRMPNLPMSVTEAFRQHPPVRVSQRRNNPG